MQSCASYSGRSLNVAIIPARGGSKRIPRKNIRKFAGKPLIGHVIEIVQHSELFDRVIVSTDDKDIADVARAFGAETPFRRPINLADDYAGTTEVISHAVDWLKENCNKNLTAVCCIYATAIFLRVDDIARGLRLMNSSQWRYVFAATNFASSVYRSFEKDVHGGIKMLFPDNFAARSQDLPETLHDAGQFYWGRPEAWINREKIFDTNSTVVRIPRWRVQDIDTEEDWLRAESIAGYLADSKF